MESIITSNARNESNERNRFESFKLGKGLPSSVAQKHSHARSHSRNASFSSSVSSMSFSASSISVNSSDVPSLSIPPPPNMTANSAPSCKRNSHHRRRSSVSTRHESAEMMGVSIPDLPPSASEDNINLGEKDSIRRRALWALEGRPDVSYSRVEIPELSTPVMEKMMFDFSSKTSVPQNNVPGYGTTLTTLMSNKRDSFKLLASSSSSKDQLHTLVEEEEEEEDAVPAKGLVNSPAETETIPPLVPEMPSVAVTKATPSRQRPASLNLRPLSLTPETLVNPCSGLPTPSLTPSPRIGLKALALIPSVSVIEDSPNPTNTMTTRQSITPTPASRRRSLNLTITPYEGSPVFLSDEDKPRRSSISYKSSRPSSSGVITNHAGLPTPEMTPTSADRRYSTSGSRRSSTSSGDEDLFLNHPTQTRPLSASEQHFLFKQHNALLARITDLERALSSRRSSGGYSNNGSSRPVSVASDISSSNDFGSSSEPSDEMLRLIADLKAERDELKRDVDGWRTRVGDMEKQLGLVAKRVEGERRDAWVARSMVGLLEVEKGTLQRKLEGVEKMVVGLEDEKTNLTKENEEARQKISSLEAELERVKRELGEERRFRQVDADIMATPRSRAPEPRPRAVAYSVKRGSLASVDSQSSATDVEDSFDVIGHKFGFSLGSVAEEEEGFEEENALVGYEDEEDSDMSFKSSSSFGSENDFPRSVKHLQADFPAAVVSNPGTSSAALPVVSHRPTHAPRASLSKTWTFPKGNHNPLSTPPKGDEIDRFFGCLEDLDGENSSGSGPVSPSTYTYEKSKGLFASGFDYATDGNTSPFFLSGGVKVSEPDGSKHVEDDDETEVGDDDDVFGDVGGIRITFTPPDADEQLELQRSPSPVKMTASRINFFENIEDEEQTVAFNFGRPALPKAAEIFKNVMSTPPSSALITPPSSDPRPSSPRSYQSSIPRAVAPLKTSGSIPTYTPQKSITTRVSSPSGYSANAFVTPPNKRGGMMPSLIPQAVSSPSPIRGTAVTVRQKTALSSSFGRQSQRKPLILANNNITKTQNISSGPAHVNPAMNARSLRRSSNHATRFTRTGSEMKSVDLSDPFNPHIISTIPTNKCPISQDRNISDIPTTPSAAPAGSSSFSSIMSSPLSTRLSFQTLTNLIPVSWGPRAGAAPESGIVPHSIPTISSMPIFGTVINTEYSGKRAPVFVPPRIMSSDISRKRGYVCKEMQLEKLRRRLEREGMMKMRTSINVCCDKCDNKVIFL